MAALVWPAAWLVAAPLAVAERAEVLRPGAAVEGELRPGETHRFGFELAAGEYVRCELEQAGIDVALALIGPGGARLKEADGAGGREVPELLSYVAAAPGEHHLEVRARPEEPRGGRYRLRREAAPAPLGAGARLVEADDVLQSSRHQAALPAAEERLQAARGLQLAARVYAAVGDLRGRALALEELGQLRLTLGLQLEALEVLHEAVRLHRQLGEPRDLALSLKAIGVAQRRLGRLGEAAGSYREALEIAHAGGDRALEAGLLNNLGTLYYARGEMEEARRLMEKTVEIRRSLGDLEGAARTQAYLGAVYFELGRSGEALAHLRQGVADARRSGEVDRQSTLLNNLGAVYRARGEIRLALQAFSEGLELAKAIGDRSREAILAANLGELYGLLNEREEALAYLQRSLALYRAMGTTASEAAILGQLGWFHLEGDDLGEASRAFEAALPLSREAKVAKTETDLLRGLGRVRLERGEAAAAVELLSAALEEKRRLPDLPGQIGTLRDLGAAQAALGRSEDAEEALRRSLELARDLGDPARQVATRYEMARLQREAGNLEAARREIEAAVEGLESLRESVPGPDLRASFRTGSEDQFELYVSLLMELEARRPGKGHAEAAFLASERSRARGLVELLLESQIDLRSGISPELAAEVRETAGRLSLLQGRLLAVLSKADPDAEERERLRAALAAADEERERIERRIRGRDPRYAQIRYPEPVGVEAAGALLDGETALLEYSLGRDESFLFVVVRDGFAVRRLGPAAPILARTRDLLAAVERPSGRRRDLLDSASRRLWELLVAPAADLLESRTRLLIAPDSDLYYLPFEALRGGARDELVLDRWAVAYVPSATVLAQLRQGAGEAARPVAGSRRLVAFADPDLPAGLGGSGVAADGGRRSGLDGETLRHLRPLPGSRREVLAIAGLYPSAAVALYLGDEATEASVKRNPLVASAERLHFASHALLDPELPALSGLLLAAAEGEDGLLQLHEIFDLRLRSELVVLSACETALGRQVSGEGLVGLTRGFLYAGARTLLVSLWQVGDRSTEELMLAFYRRLEGGAGVSEALRQAKRALRDGGRFDHPYYWAPFIAVGDPDR